MERILTRRPVAAWLVCAGLYALATLVRMLMLAALVCCIASAAAWDGTRNDVTVTSASFDAGPWFGLAWPVPSTYIIVSSTDQTVTGFRVTVRLMNVFGQPEERTQAVHVAAPFPSAVYFLGANEASIMSVRVTRLRDGESEEFTIEKGH